jgi:enamine deaminase RidA (YjgF/YER057c/UK114 family)
MLAEKLKSLDITLPPVSGPFGSYIPARRAGNLIYIAGQLPMKDGKLMATGPVPSRCSLEAARAAAKQCIINAIAAVQSLPGGIDQITGVVRVGAFVHSDNTFTEQPKVADAASELLTQIFGEEGKHARAAVGVNVLPRDASVEIEVIFEATP